ncbi:CpsB/CapC family capsule biosynthesis tyrosine phosphatase [Latilactobacillus sakei]|uniref:CpsB/CapC family capsule biosynthesis tyrosine phosphatase n=1 Tax=Latilactobacillus sakei TaxID=1599 RepID=UPI002072C96C|nr:CpsB/CapC family capsule biosynthesis tyrosine phosphatase [Latilactobacillus sakei]
MTSIQLFADETNRYLMLELPHGEVPEYTNQMIFELQAAGITPVIVHPERNHGIQKKPELLYDFVASGCLTQITASSYLGVFGSEVEDFTQRIIDAGLGFVFASDAHNLKGRNFRMQKAFAKLEQHNGAEMVTWMQDNAKKIINGDDLEPSEYHYIKEKKKFWLFR